MGDFEFLNDLPDDEMVEVRWSTTESFTAQFPAAQLRQAIANGDDLDDVLDLSDYEENENYAGTTGREVTGVGEQDM